MGAGPFTAIPNYTGTGAGAAMRADLNSRVQALVLQSVSVKSFGAVGDGTTNDTTSIQAAIDWCIANFKALFFPKGTYKVTLSLNATANSANQNFTMFGEGRRVSKIVHTLVESRPVVDFAGNGRGAMRWIAIEASGGVATCGLRCSKGTSGGSIGNGITIEGCFISAGNVAGDTALDIWNSDLTRVVDCEISGLGAGVTVGESTAANVVSKFVTDPGVVDTTAFYIERCEVTASAGPAIDYTGGAAIHLSHVYAALTGAGLAGKIIRVSDVSGISGNQIFAYGLRTEDQSSASGVSAIWFDASSTGGTIEGALTTDSTGHMIGGAAGKNISGFDMNLSASNGDLFAMLGAVARCRIQAQTSNAFGSIGDLTSNTHDVKIRGNITEASAATAGMFNTPGFEIAQGGFNYLAPNSRVIIPTDTAVTARMALNLGSASINAGASYVGGAGEASILTYVIPIAVFQTWVGVATLQSGLLRLRGHLNAANAGGRIRIQLTQGATVAFIGDWSSMPSGNTTKGARIDIEFNSVGTVNLRSFVEYGIGGTIWSPGDENLQGLGFTASAGDITLDVMVTNAGNAPLVLTYRELGLK